MSYIAPARGGHFLTSVQIQTDTGSFNASQQRTVVMATAAPAGSLLALAISIAQLNSVITSITGGGVTWRYGVQARPVPGVAQSTEIWFGGPADGSGGDLLITIDVGTPTFALQVVEFTELATVEGLPHSYKNSGSAADQTNVNPTTNIGCGTVIPVGDCLIFAGAAWGSAANASIIQAEFNFVGQVNQASTRNCFAWGQFNPYVSPLNQSPFFTLTANATNHVGASVVLEFQDPTRPLRGGLQAVRRAAFL